MKKDKTITKSSEKQINRTTQIEFYSLICKDEKLQKYNLLETTPPYDRILKILPLLHDGIYGLEVTYHVSYDFNGQPYLVDLQYLERYIKNPPTNEDESSQSCPLLSDGDFEIDIEDFEPIKINILDIETKGSIPINALQINENHPDFNSKSNKIISYRDELPNDDDDIYLGALRELLLEKDEEYLKEFPFYFGTLKESYWQNENEFPEKYIDEIKLFLTIENFEHIIKPKTEKF